MNANAETETKTVDIYLSDIEKGANRMREALMSRNQAAIMAAAVSYTHLTLPTTERV